ncbi:MAG: hypothetical protein AAF432_03605 [Planctomycetota bacterium]
MMHRLHTTLAMIGGAVVCSASAFAADRHVPSSYPTIQAAINASNAGDHVVIAPGTYNEAIVLNGKAITVSGADAESTIIDAYGLYASGIRCVHGEGSNTVIEDLTVINGRGTFESNRRKGGGMFNKNSSPTVRDCVFRENRILAYESNIDGSGAGMYNEQASPTVIGCQFENNELLGCSGWLNGGAGMYNDNGSPYVAKCTFMNNEGNNGGGMMNINGAWPTVVNCRFDGNVVTYSGGGINCTNGSGATIANAVFYANEAWHGAGVYLHSSTVTMTSSTLSANASGRIAGGLYAISSPVAANVTNSIFWNNTAEQEPNDAEIATWASGAPALLDCVVQGGWGQYGNHTFDPMFIDALSGNLELQDNSPAIDRGETDAMPTDLADLDSDGNTWEMIPMDADGSPRLAGDALDLGAHEHWPIIEASCTGDVTPPGGNGMVNTDDLVAVIIAYGACTNCAEDIAPVGGNGSVNVDDVLTTINAFGACP